MFESQNITQLDAWNQFIANGNEEALSLIYADNYDLLFDYGMRYTSSIQLVEDVIQDVFVNIIKYRKTIGLVKNIKGYLISTFRRQLFLELNKKKKIISTEQMPEGFFDYFKSPDNEIADKEETEFLHTTISDCINNLSTKQKEIIYLRFEREIPYEEIASILNISVESCYKSIYRTIKTIRNAAEKALLKSGQMIFGLTPDQILKNKSLGN